MSLNLYQIKAVGWKTLIFVTASTPQDAVKCWCRYRKSEVLKVELIGRCVSSISDFDKVFLDSGSSSIKVE